MTNIANTLTLRNPESISEKTSATALKRSLLLLIGCVLIVNSPLTFAEIYKWVDENGKVHYGDKPKDEQSKKLEIKKNTSQA